MSLFKAALPYALAIGVASAVGYGLFSFGSSTTANKYEVRIAKEKQEHEDRINLLKAEYAKKEETHREENRNLSFELSASKERHALELGDLARRHAERMRTSENRATVYQRQAEAGEAECRNLASHAAKLDASLERGRDLVARLAETLRLRDEQLILLGQKIQSDYELLKD